MKKVLERIIKKGDKEFSSNISLYGYNGLGDELLNDKLRKELNKTNETEFIKTTSIDKSIQYEAITPIGEGKYKIEVFKR